MKRPRYIVTIRPEPGVDGVSALRAFLKVALRRFGMRCVALSEVNEESAS